MVNIAFSTKKGPKTPKMQKKKKKLVQGCVKNWSKYAAQQIWTSCKHNILVVFFVVFASFQQPFLVQGERDFHK